MHDPFFDDCVETLILPEAEGGNGLSRPEAERICQIPPSKGKETTLKKTVDILTGINDALTVEGNDP